MPPYGGVIRNGDKTMTTKPTSKAQAVEGVKHKLTGYKFSTPDMLMAAVAPELTPDETVYALAEGLAAIQRRMRREGKADSAAVIRDLTAPKADKIEALRNYPIAVRGEIIPLCVASLDDVEAAIGDFDKTITGLCVRRDELIRLVKAAKQQGAEGSMRLFQALSPDEAIRAFNG